MTEQERWLKTGFEILCVAATAAMVILFFSCTPQPTPTPNPTPSPRVIETKRESFDSGLGSWVDGKRAKAIGGQLVLDSGVDGRSAWAHTTAFQSDSLISFTVRARQASDDFCIGLAPSVAIDHVAENGFFGLPTRARYYIAKDGNVRKLYRHFRASGKTSEGYFDEVFAVAAPPVVRTPCELRLEFDGSGRMKYLYRDSVTAWSAWVAVGADSLPPAMRGEVSFEASAYSTPFKGVAKIDWAEVSYYTAKSETLTVRIQWNPNSEPDLAAYKVSRLGGETQTTTALEYRTRAKVGDGFFVRAVDTAGNVSAPSETVYVKRKED